MSLAPALTGPELAALAKPSVARWYAVFDDSGGDPVGTARIASAPTFPLSTLPITGQSVNWGNIKPDDIVLIGSAAGTFDRGIYRVRWQAFGADYPNLQIGQIGVGDSGEINLATRNTTISSEDYVTVLDRNDLFSKQPRIDYPGIGLDATIYEDEDRGVFTENTYPAPFVNVWLDGRPAHLGVHVYTDTSYTFDIVFQPWSWWGATVSYTVVLPAGWTLNSGALIGTVGFGGTVTLNVTAPHSTHTYKVQFICDDPTGTSAQFTALRKVWITSDTYPPLSINSIDNDIDDRTGSRMTVSFNRLVSAPAGGMWHVFNMGRWGGVDVPTARKSFTGWVVGRRETTGIGVANVSLDLEGPSYILGRIGGQSQIFTAVNAVTLSYQELYYGHSHVDFIIFWLVWQRMSGMLTMFNYNPLSWPYVTNWFISDWRIDAGTLLEQIQAQARRVRGGNFGCDATGEMWFRSDVSRLPWSERGSVPIRVTLDAGMYDSASLGFEQRPGVKRLRGEAFDGQDPLNLPIAYWSDAVQVGGQGTRDEKLERMLARSESEHWDVTGQELTARNNPYPQGSTKIPKNWAVFYPAQMERVGLDIVPALRYDGIEYSGYILLLQAAYTHNPDGTVDTNLNWAAETVGVPGVHVDIPVPDPSTYNSPYQAVPFARVPTVRRLNPNPAGTKNGANVLPKDGSVGFGGTATAAYSTLNIFGTPQYRVITPSTIGAYTIRHGFLQTGTKKGYLLGSDGTNSRVFKSDDVFKQPKPVWQTGNTFPGVYETIRQGAGVNEVLVYGPQNITTSVDPCFTEHVSWQVVYDFTEGQLGWTGDSNPFTDTHWSGAGWYSNTNRELGLHFDLGGLYSLFWIKIEMLNCTNIHIFGTYGTNPDHQSPSGGFTTAVDYNAAPPSCTEYFLKGGTPAGPLPNNLWPVRYLQVEIDHNGGNGPAGALCTKITLAGIDNTPPTPHRTTTVRYSSDDGLNFGAALAVVTDGLGAVQGFDTERSGAVSYAAGALATKKASTGGGAYGADQTWTTNPGLIEVPWSKRGSSTLNNTGASPEYIVGLLAADGSGHSLYWIVGGVPVNITPVIGGQPGIPVGPDCLTSYLGKYLAYLGSFGGTTRLVTSKDSGATWIDRGAVDARYVRVRRLANQPGQFYIAGNVFDYTSTLGATLIPKTKPSSSALVFFEAYN